VTTRVVAIAPGDPHAPETLAGVSAGLLGALRDRGALAGAVSGRAAWLNAVERAAAFSFDRRRRAQAYAAGATPLSTVVRAAMGETARRRAEPIVRDTGADATLQLTSAWETDVPGVLRASYHVTSLATLLRDPGLRLDPASRAVRRALAWERRLYDEMDVILTASEPLRATFLDAYGQPPDKVVTVGAADAGWDAVAGRVLAAVAARV
jgi:hypothetical protein